MLAYPCEISRVRSILLLTCHCKRAAARLLAFMDEGYKVILLNLAGTRIINSIGISILIEIIEKMVEIGGRLAFCCLTPTIEKTFHVMGLTQYTSIYPDEDSTVASL